MASRHCIGCIVCPLEISEEDAIAEGIEPVKTYADQFLGWFDYEHDDEGAGYYFEAINSYDSLWSSVNGPDSWDTNPWVWAVTVRVHKKNIDQFLKHRQTA
jgi:hypothetical protein